MSVLASGTAGAGLGAGSTVVGPAECAADGVVGRAERGEWTLAAGRAAGALVEWGNGSRATSAAADVEF